MLKQLTTVLMLLLVTNRLSAQQKPKINIWDPPVQKNISNLNIGDKVPDFRLAKIFNNQTNAASMADYNDQLVIFDFGNLYCKGCVEALPHMDSLQKEFGNKIKIFWVTPEYKEDVARFWNRVNNPLTKNNTISTIVEDSTVRAYFKHKTWPHEAWIYKGKVIALTSAQYVDRNNIAKVLSGETINWPVKNDFYVFDKNKPLFQLDDHRLDTADILIKYAAISDYKEDGVNPETLSGGNGIVRNSSKKTVRAFFINQPIYNSYLINLLKITKPGVLIKPASIGIGPNEIIWEVKDKTKYQYDKKSGYQMDWMRKNGICFESLNPDTGQTDKDIATAIIADMNHLLGLNVRWEKRKEKVLVLKRTSVSDRLKSKTTTKNTINQLHTKGNIQQFRAAPLSLITFIMNQQPGNPYVFDETNYQLKSDLDLEISSWTDIAAIRKALVPYGLALKEEERWIDKFIFTEINGGLLKN